MAELDIDAIYEQYEIALDKEVELSNAREQLAWRWHDSFAPYIVGVTILGVMHDPLWFWGYAVISIAYLSQMSFVQREFRRAKKRSSELEKQLDAFDD